MKSSATETGNNIYLGTYSVRKISTAECGIHMPAEVLGTHFSIYRNDTNGVLTLIPQGVKDTVEKGMF
jgi:hypothetical protein